MDFAESLSLIVSNKVSIANVESSYHKFLNSVKIVPLNEESKHRIPAKLKFRTDYKKYIKLLVAELLKSQSENVLVSGLPKIRRGGFVATTSNSVYSSFVINELHSFDWNRVFDILGSANMTDLLLNWKGFIVKNGAMIQIFGDKLTYTGQKTTTQSKLIKKSTLFHHLQSRPRYWEFTLIHQTANELLTEIFGANTKAKRFRRIKYLFNTIVQNDQACKYHLIYQQLLHLEKSVDPHNICSNASSFQEVIRFVFVILGKLLSLEAWGGQENKTVLRKRIEEYLKLDSRGALHIHDIVKGLCLNDFLWLGTTPKVTSKQDFEIRQKLLQEYVQWLFTSLLRGIVRAF